MIIRSILSSALVAALAIAGQASAQSAQQGPDVVDLEGIGNLLEQNTVTSGSFNPTNVDASTTIDASRQDIRNRTKIDASQFVTPTQTAKTKNSAEDIQDGRNDASMFGPVNHSDGGNFQMGPLYQEKRSMEQPRGYSAPKYRYQPHYGHPAGDPVLQDARATNWGDNMGKVQAINVNNGGMGDIAAGGDVSKGNAIGRFGNEVTTNNGPMSQGQALDQAKVSDTNATVETDQTALTSR